MEKLDHDTQEGRDTYRAILEIEKQMKRSWYKELKERGEDVPYVMGRSVFQSSKQFHEDIERQDKEE